MGEPCQFSWKGGCIETSATVRNGCIDKSEHVEDRHTRPRDHTLTERVLQSTYRARNSVIRPIPSGSTVRLSSSLGERGTHREGEGGREGWMEEGREIYGWTDRQTDRQRGREGGRKGLRGRKGGEREGENTRRH